MDCCSLTRFVYRTCSFLNDARYEDWLLLCDPERFRYTVKVYSPEISSDMTWLDHDLDGVRNLFSGLKQHVTLPGSFQRHVGMVDLSEAEQGSFKATSAVAVYYTTEAGRTELFALATYEDRLTGRDESVRLTSRIVRLNTRVLPTGPHVIL